MSRTLFIICFLVVSKMISGQLLDWEHLTRKDSASSFLQLRGNYRLDSDHIPGAFLNKFIFGGMIDKKDKDLAYSYLGASNHLYLQSDLGITWKSSIDAKGWRYGLAIADIRRGFAFVPAELFRLLFYGNASDKVTGEVFTDAKGTFYQAKQVSIFSEKMIKTDNSRWILSAGASVLQANKMMHLDWPEGQLQTADHSNEIYFAGKTDLYLGDRTNHPGWGTDGWGVSGEIGLSIKKKSGFAQISIKELGIIRSTASATHYSRNAQKTYEGVDPAQLFSDISALNLPSDADSVYQKLDIERTEENFTIITPALFAVEAGHRSGDFDFKYGIRYRLNAWPLPLAFAALAWSPERGNWQYQTLLYGGGAGQFDLGIGVQHRLNDQLQWTLGSDHLLVLLAGRRFGGVSAYFGLKWNL